MDQTNTPDPTTELASDDPRALFARAVALCSTVIDGVAPDQLDSPTPCAGTDARGLLEHLVMVLRRVACAGRGDDPMTWPEAAPDAESRWGDAWRDAAHEMRNEWTDDALLARPTELPWGTFDGAAVLGAYTNEIVVHTWDLARATGQDPEWDHDVLEAAWVAIHQQLPMADRTAMWEAAKAQLPPDLPWEWEDPFANAVDVDDDAPLIDRLVAWNGRRP